MATVRVGALPVKTSATKACSCLDSKIPGSRPLLKIPSGELSPPLRYTPRAMCSPADYFLVVATKDFESPP
jgi:hypothetical protein